MDVNKLNLSPIRHSAVMQIHCRSLFDGKQKSSQYAVPLTCLGALSKDNHVVSLVGKKHHETAFPS